MMIYERNSKLLDKLFKRAGYNGLSDYAERSLRALKTEGSTSPVTIDNSPFMALHIEYIYPHVIAMSHTFKQNGDLMRDPELEIRISGPEILPDCVEVLSYRQDSLGIYQVVYPEPGKVYTKLKGQLNSFLSQWLHNLKEQGFFEGDNPEGGIPFGLDRFGISADQM